MSKPKEYPLEIEELGANCGEDTWLYSKGHHDTAEFVRLVCQESGFDDIKPEDVSHKLARWQFTVDPCSIGEKPELRLMMVKEPGSGVFPVTILEL